MYKPTPECWIGSHGPQICASPFHQGGFASGILNHQDDNEEEDEEVFPASCHHTTGCDDSTHQSDRTQWFTCGPPGLPGSDHSSQHQVAEAEHVEMLQECADCCCAEGQVIETNPCAGVYGQREQEGLNPCWSESPPNYYVVRRNMVLEVEVVEEVAVEDTVELMTEDLFADGFLDVEFLQGEQLYPP